MLRTHSVGVSEGYHLFLWSRTRGAVPWMRGVEEGKGDTMTGAGGRARAQCKCIGFGRGDRERERERAHVPRLRLSRILPRRSRLPVPERCSGAEVGSCVMFLYYPASTEWEWVRRRVVAATRTLGPSCAEHRVACQEDNVGGGPPTFARRGIEAAATKAGGLI